MDEVGHVSEGRVHLPVRPAVEAGLPLCVQVLRGVDVARIDAHFVVVFEFGVILAHHVLGALLLYPVVPVFVEVLPRTKVEEVDAPRGGPSRGFRVGEVGEDGKLEEVRDLVRGEPVRGGVT